ncbi:MAG: AAA-like domain-containing protein [Candidatus Aminicenantes bacterium]|nr:MAG: AAA-like domain-containing protein [Candidatus Aminicenantes bacterium]
MSDTTQINKNFYVVGGSMQPDAPSYIERKADNEIYERTLASDFCYVLTPRQMGKSSLMARTAQRLKKQGIQTVIVDLSQIGSEKEKESANQWYCGIADCVLDKLGMEMDIGKWWEERKHLPALLRLTRFFRDVVLANATDQVVIFVDEIDTTIALPFTDDFFAAIRACYNARATEPVYRRLSFVLLGVATPSQLIKDTRRTPFNIGHRIELTDFTPEEALPLARGLGNDQIKSEEILKRILYWTGGHPYLTQKLCRLAVDEKPGVYNDEYIDGLVKKYFLAPGASHQDANLNFVRDRLVHKKNPVRRILTLYRRILQGRPITDEPLSFIHTALKLSGLVVLLANRKLSVRNRIYELTFTTDWAKKVMPTYWTKHIEIISIAAILIALIIAIEVIIPGVYIENIRTAQDDVPIQEYKTLRTIPGYSGTAEDLLAQYWDRRALRAEAVEKRDEGVLYRLQAMKVKDTEIRRREVGCLIKDDYENILTTYRHNKDVKAVAFSPGGPTVITINGDNTARLWSADTGEPLGKIIKHRSSFYYNALFSPDGRTVLTGISDDTARLWRTDTGEPVGKLIIHGSSISTVAFSPDGRTVLTVSRDGKIRLWCADTGENVGELMLHGSSVSAVAISPDGRTVLTGSSNGIVRLWWVDTGEPVGNIMKHNYLVGTVAFSPDGKTVLTGSTDNTARLWRADTGEIEGKIMKHDDHVSAAAFSPDGRTLITGSSDGTARLWQTDTGEPLGKIMKHDDHVSAAAFSPDNRTVLTGSRDGTALLWQADTGEPVGKIMKHDGYVFALSFSPDGRSVFTGRYEEVVRLWRVDTGEPVGKPMIHHDSATAAAFSPDGRTLITGSFRIARLWRTDTGEPVGKKLEHNGIVSSVAFSPDGRTVLTGCFKTASLWRTDTCEPVGKPIIHYGLIRSVSYSPDGRTVTVATDNWIHQSDIYGDTIKPKASRLLPGIGTGAYRFLDDKGDKMHVAVKVTGNSIKIYTIRFDIPDAPPIKGNPDELMEEWQKKLALKLDEETGKIEPMYPIEVPRERVRK